MSDNTPTYRPSRKKWQPLAMGLALLFSMASCINEDLSECGSYCDFTFRITTEMDLEQSVTAHLSTGAAEQEMAQLLIDKLSPVFSGNIHHLEVPFFDSGSRTMSHYETVAAGGADEVAYSLYLEQGTYHHHPVANAATDPVCRVSGRDHLDHFTLSYIDADTIDSFTCGIYHAGLDVESDGTDKNLHIPLGMANTAVALVLSPAVDSVVSYIANTANGYSFADSSYDFSSPALVRTSKVLTRDLVASYGVCFPSRGGETVARATTRDAEYWQMHVYVTRNGKTTRNVLSVREPLAAGEPKILRATISDSGEIIYHGADVTVSVTLDWKPGGDHNIEI